MVAKVPSMVFTHYMTVILNNIQDAILLVDIEPRGSYRMVMANEAFFKETGYPRDSIGKTVQQIVHTESWPKLRSRYEKAASTKKIVEYSEWYEMPRGKLLYNVKMLPIFNAVGECVQLAIITRDLTEMHHMREQQKEAAETLEQVAYNLRLTS